MKSLLAVLSIGFFLTPTIANADVLFEGYRGIAGCFEIDNLNEYPDYVFLLVYVAPGGDMGGAVVLGQSDCPSVYKFGSGRFAVIEKDRFNDLLGEGYEVSYGTILDRSSGGSAQTWVNDHKSQLVFSDIELRGGGTSVPDANPLKEIRYRYHIDEVTIGVFATDRLVVQHVGDDYVYQDGRREPIPVDSKEIPPVPSNKMTFSWAWFVLAPTLGAILLIVLFQTWKRSRP